MSEMIDRVARAIWDQRRKKAAADYPDLPPLEEFGDGTIPRMNGVFEEARGAIAAMRKATDAMLEHFVGAETPYERRDAWEGVMDEALK